MEPRSSEYGPSSSGRIFLATLRGNDNLKSPKISDKRLNFGNKWLEAGVVIDSYDPKKSENMLASIDVKGGWHKRFHIFRIVWKPGKKKRNCFSCNLKNYYEPKTFLTDGFEWYVDGEKLGAGSVSPPEKGFLNRKNLHQMAPFDQEVISYSAVRKHSSRLIHFDLFSVFSQLGSGSRGDTAFSGWFSIRRSAETLEKSQSQSKKFHFILALKIFFKSTNLFFFLQEHDRLLVGSCQLV